MPKLKKTRTEALSSKMRANINYYATYYGYDRDDLARTIGKSKATMDRRLSDPLSFTIDELMRLAQSFHVPLADLMETEVKKC